MLSPNTVETLCLSSPDIHWVKFRGRIELNQTKNKNLIQVLVIMSYSSNTNSTPQRLQFVSLSEMTDCHTHYPSTSTNAVSYHPALEPNIYFYRGVGRIASSVWRRGGVSPSIAAREGARKRGEREREWVPLFCSLPSLTGSVWLPPARSG